MSTLASDIFADVRDQINDTGAARWTDAALIRYLNAGTLEVVKAKPDAYMRRAAVQLAYGSAYQKVLPVDIVQLVDVTRNLGIDGLTPGRAITKVQTIAQMDKASRNWALAVPNDRGDIAQWIPADPEPDAFFVYPRPPEQVATYVEALYSIVPPAIAAVTDAIPTRPVYDYQLKLFVIGRALMQDIPQGDQPRGLAFLAEFSRTLGGTPPTTQARR
jgi:Family of unknown function (DUF6682)